MKKNKIRYILFFLSIALFHSKKSHAYLAKDITIDNAISIAFQTRSSIKERYYDILAKRDTAWSELSGYFPQVVVSTNLQNNKNSIFPHNQSLIEFSQLLVSFSGPFQQYNMAKQNIEISELIRNQELDNVRFEVESNYLAYWLILQKYHAIKARYYASQETFMKNKHEYLIGLQSVPTWYESKANYASNRAIVESYKDDVGQRKAELERALELPITSINQSAMQSYITQKIEMAQSYELPFYLQRALLWRKELGIIHAAIERERQQRSFFAKSYIPTVSFFTTVSDGRVAALTDRTTMSIFWQYGLEFSWHFDGLANIHRSNASNEQLLEQQMALENKKMQIIRDVKVIYYELQSLTHEHDAQVKELAHQRKLYQKRMHQFRIGEISLPTFKIAQKEWQEAQFAFHEIETKTAIKQRELEFACGYPNA